MWIFSTALAGFACGGTSASPEKGGPEAGPATSRRSVTLRSSPPSFKERHGLKRFEFESTEVAPPNSFICSAMHFPHAGDVGHLEFGSRVCDPEFGKMSLFVPPYLPLVIDAQ
jgi:hypothetical protein